MESRIEPSVLNRFFTCLEIVWRMCLPVKRSNLINSVHLTGVRHFKSGPGPLGTASGIKSVRFDNSFRVRRLRTTALGPVLKSQSFDFSTLDRPTFDKFPLRSIIPIFQHSIPPSLYSSPLSLSPFHPSLFRTSHFWAPLLSHSSVCLPNSWARQ
jgi:hypothetical protein